MRGTHRWQVNSPHKGPVTRNVLPFDAVIMINGYNYTRWTGDFQIKRLLPSCTFLINSKYVKKQWEGTTDQISVWSIFELIDHSVYGILVLIWYMLRSAWTHALCYIFYRWFNMTEEALLKLLWPLLDFTLSRSWRRQLDYRDVTSVIRWPETLLFVKQIVQAKSQENIKLLITLDSP